GRRNVGYGEWVDTVGVLAVGEGSDDGAAVVADVDLALVVVEGVGVDGDGLAGDGVQGRQQALADRRPAPDRDVVDGGEGVGVVRRGVLHDHRTVAEGHDTDLHRRRLLHHKGPGRGLGGLDAA